MNVQVKGLEADMKEWHRARGKNYTLQGKLTMARIKTSAECIPRRLPK